VDDKRIRKAKETGETVPELADKYTTAFLADAAGLRAKPTVNPRVTENMLEIIAFIAALVEKGVAYESGGDVYFRTESFPKYGQISHKNLDELQHGIRFEVDTRKRSPQDFVLWKKAKSGEINWSSPWGAGRPGWHIECSAMAAKYLGTTIDIHGGGEDLQFPHHECEAAQSESLHGKPLSNYWMHVAFLNIDDEKMSKSLGNGMTVREILKSSRGEWVRYIILSSHYRHPLNYKEDSLMHAEAGVERLNNCYANLRYRLQTITTEASVEAEADAAGLSSASEAREGIRLALEHFKTAMDEDFNTPEAITAMFELTAAANRYLHNEQVTPAVLSELIAAFADMDAVLQLLYSEAGEDRDEEVERLIEERQTARQTKNWARADEIRDLLTDKGIVLEDTPQGIRWRRK